MIWHDFPTDSRVAAADDAVGFDQLEPDLFFAGQAGWQRRNRERRVADLDLGVNDVDRVADANLEAHALHRSSRATRDRQLRALPDTDRTGRQFRGRDA